MNAKAVMPYHQHIPTNLCARRPDTAEPSAKRLTRCTTLILLIASLCVFKCAGDEASQRSETAPLIDLKIETSRAQPTAGTGLGVIGNIKNQCGTNVYLKAEQLLLVLPPELSGNTNELSTVNALYAVFATETSADTNDLWNTSILIKPGDSYKAFWSTAPSTLKISPNFIENMWYVFLSEMNFTFFTPGDYKITVMAKYWTDPTYPTNDFRIVTQDLTIHVAAPQFVILVGAALGGLIAYFILPQARSKFVKVAKRGLTNTDKFLNLAEWFSKEVAGILGAALLSSMATIMLSRISETQFLISVTVNDFWGAIAIGFLANYAGVSLLEKMLDRAAKKQNSSSTHNTTVSAAEKPLPSSPPR